jgi:lysophospholipase L1-like esterase
LQLECPTTKIYLQSILPLNPDVNGFPQHYDKQEHVVNTNKLLKAVAESVKIDFVDLFPLFTDSNGKLDAKYTADGLHLKPDGEGYKIWVNHLRSKGYL